MGVFWITTPAIGSNGKNYGFIFEHSSETVEELADLLAERQIVGGNRLRTVDDGRGGRLVQARAPTALTPRGIAQIVLYTGGRVWEPDEV